MVEQTIRNLKGQDWQYKDFNGIFTKLSSFEEIIPEVTGISLEVDKKYQIVIQCHLHSLEVKDVNFMNTIKSIHNCVHWTFILTNGKNQSLGWQCPSTFMNQEDNVGHKNNLKIDN